MSFIGPPVINFENTQQHTHVISYQMNTPRTNMCRTVYKCSLRLVARAKPAHRFLLRVTHFVRDEMTSSTIHTTRSKIQIPDSTHSRIQDLASIFWRRSQIWGSRDRSDLIFRVWSEVWNLDSRFGILTPKSPLEDEYACLRAKRIQFGSLQKQSHQTISRRLPSSLHQ